MSRADSPQETGDVRTRVPVAGGTLVYEERDIGRDLVGFEDVEDWGDLTDALDERGFNRGALYHLPVLDRGETP